MYPLFIFWVVLSFNSVYGSHVPMTDEEFSLFQNNLAKIAIDFSSDISFINKKHLENNEYISKKLTNDLALIAWGFTLLKEKKSLQGCKTLIKSIIVGLNDQDHLSYLIETIQKGIHEATYRKQYGQAFDAAFKEYSQNSDGLFEFARDPKHEELCVHALLAAWGIDDETPSPRGEKRLLTLDGNISIF